MLNNLTRCGCTPIICAREYSCQKYGWWSPLVSLCLPRQHFTEHRCLGSGRRSFSNRQATPLGRTCRVLSPWLPPTVSFKWLSFMLQNTEVRPRTVLEYQSSIPWDTEDVPLCLYSAQRSEYSTLWLSIFLLLGWFCSCTLFPRKGVGHASVPSERTVSQG